MKKSLLVLSLILVFASSSFAGVSFLTADSVGTGKVALLGVYATNHNGAVANTDGNLVHANDTTSLGLKVEYGIMENLDVLVAYTQDAYPNMYSLLDVKAVDGATTGLGVKYTVMKGVVDVAAVLGYESTTVKIDGVGSGMTTYTLAAVVSKKINMFIPYGGIGLKSLSRNATAGVAALGGTALAWNLGCAIGVAENQAVMIEMNHEIDAWNAPSKLDDAMATSVGGISLGYAYMF
jgi:hypothetical protein